MPLALPPGLTPLNSSRAGIRGQNLKALLEATFGKVTLGQIKTPLILPSVDIGNGCVHVFKSKYDNHFLRDPGVRVSDAVLASCAAPTYFDPVVIAGKYRLADGGLWANNPSLVAAIEAHYRLQVPLQRVKVLSIGTGKGNAFYPLRLNRLTRPPASQLAGLGLRWPLADAASSST